jgi:hypothetical protein
VTVIAVLAILAGVMAGLAGLGVAMAAATTDLADETRAGPGVIAYLVLWCLGAGLLQVVAGVFLFRAANWARVLLTVLLVVHILLNAINAATRLDTSGSVLFVTIVAVPAILLLWTRRANTWFG